MAPALFQPFSVVAVLERLSELPLLLIVDLVLLILADNAGVFVPKPDDDDTLSRAFSLSSIAPNLESISRINFANCTSMVPKKGTQYDKRKMENQYSIQIAHRFT